MNKNQNTIWVTQKKEKRKEIKKENVNKWVKKKERDRNKREIKKRKEGGRYRGRETESLENARDRE